MYTNKMAGCKKGVTGRAKNTLRFMKRPWFSSPCEFPKEKNMNKTFRRRERCWRPKKSNLEMQTSGNKRNAF